MNILTEYQKKIIEILKKLENKNILSLPKSLNGITVEISPKNQKSEISCNAALILSKINNLDPIKCGQILKDSLLKNFKEFDSVEVAQPGFLNIKFKTEFWKIFLLKIINNKKIYGSNISQKKKYNIEFVSANPTGPLHVGHCRGAILGDVLANILKFNGNSVVKEYFVNDYGNQVKNFVLSVYYRILEIVENKKFPDEKNLYPGLYIVDIAKKIIDKKIIKNFNNFENIYSELASESLSISMNLIKNDLLILGVQHDNFVYESNLIKENKVLNTIKELEKLNFIYKGKLKSPKGETSHDWKSRDQLLFKSTLFGDDIDRPLQKSDKSWTYFASDIAYHSNKIARGYNMLINILGADHTGYVKRLEAAVNALSKNSIPLICKVSQLVKLFKNKKPLKMSKRSGDYIKVSDLINEVGKDSARFIMLNRSNDVELDFDFEKVTEKSKDNPVFYVQYAYARINSIFRSLKMDINYKIDLSKETFEINDYELEILKKISAWPRCVEISSKKLEPHRIPYYLYDLATLFHSYWNLGKENKKYKFIEKDKPVSKTRLALLQSLETVIKNGMLLLGVSTPESM